MIHSLKYIFQAFHQFSRYKFSLLEPKQFIDNYWQMEQKVKRLSELIKAAKYPIILTGAGISTSLGIPDYRSGRGTVIKTGTGLWNRQYNSESKDQKHQIPIDKLVDLAKPSISHMCIHSLIKKGLIKHLISQNTDGLHLKSGISLDNISELHGNRNLQFCTSCHRKYFRDFRTLKRDGKKYNPGQKRSHETGRNCENCGGQLYDSIIYFGQKLPRDQLINAYTHSNKADLCICIGSSLTVKPSSNIPKMVTDKDSPGKLCIINIQETPLDQFAELNIHYFCDEALQLLAKHLNFQIQKLKVQHFIKVQLIQEGQFYQIILQGKDQDNNNLTFMRKANLIISGKINHLYIQGHKCVGQIIKSDLQKDISVEIFHYGLKKQAKLNISCFNLRSGQPLELSYQTQQIYQQLNAE